MNTLKRLLNWIFSWRGLVAVLVILFFVAPDQSKKAIAQITAAAGDADVNLRRSRPSPGELFVCSKVDKEESMTEKFDDLANLV